MSEKFTDYNLAEPAPHVVRRIREHDRGRNEVRSHVFQYMHEVFPTYKNRNLVDFRLSLERRDGNDHAVEKTWTRYKSHADSLGLLDREWVWNGGSSQAPQLPGTSNSTELMRYTSYDAWGRLLRKTDAAGLETRYEYGGPGMSRLQRIVAGRFTQGDTLQTTITYNTRGQVTAVVDPNGRATRFAYDGLNRLTAVRGHGNELLASHAYHIAGSSLSPSSPNYVHTRHYGLNDNDYVETTEFFDGLGRPIQSIVRGQTGNDIITAVEYDGLGRVWRQWKPYQLTRTPGSGRLRMRRILPVWQGYTTAPYCIHPMHTPHTWKRATRPIP